MERKRMEEYEGALRDEVRWIQTGQRMTEYEVSYDDVDR